MIVANPEIVRDRDEMIRLMEPKIVQGSYSFATVENLSDVPRDVRVFASVLEAEGMSVLVSFEDIGKFSSGTTVSLGWITLQVNSSLEGVGLTAAVSAVLA